MAPNFEENSKSVHDERKPFQCSKCGSVFSLKENLKRHIKIVHLKENEFSCDICKKKFTTKQNKDIHQQQIHKNIIQKIEYARTKQLLVLC